MLPPNVLVPNLAIGLNETIALRNMFTVSDADGDSIVRYELIDNGAGGGQFEFNGSVIAPSVPFFFTANNLDNIIYRGGDRFGRESITIRAFDSTGLDSARVSGFITSGNSRPSISSQHTRLRVGESLRVDQFFKVFDRDGDAILDYTFADSMFGFGSGRLAVNGQAQFQTNPFTVLPFQLPTVFYRASPVGGTQEYIDITVRDQFSSSLTTRLWIKTSLGAQVQGTNAEVLTNEKIAASKLFNIFDTEGDAVRRYWLVDRSHNDDGGYFEWNGQRMPSARFFSVPAAELANVFYVGAMTSQSENVGVQTWDGFDHGTTTDVLVKTVSRPVVTPTVDNYQIRSNRSVSAMDLFSAFDADGDTITRYWVVDRSTNQGGGHFELDGVRLDSGRFMSLTPDQLPNLIYKSGTFGPQTENIGVQVRAGKHVSDIVDFMVTTTPNDSIPQIIFPDISAPIGTIFKASELFSYSDSEGDPLFNFGFYDTGAGLDTGYFSYQGNRLSDQTWHRFQAAELADLNYHVGDMASMELIRFFATDGRNSSGLITASAEAFEAAAVAFKQTSISLDTLEFVPFSSLLMQTDSGPAFVEYQVLDEFRRIADGPVEPADRSSQLVLDGVRLQQGIVHTLTPEEFARLQIQGAEADFGRNLDPIMVRATNGTTGYSEWKRINVNTDPVGTKSLEYFVEDDAGDLFLLRPPELATAPGATNDGRRIFTYTFIDGGNQGGNGTKERPDVPPLPSYYLTGFGPMGDMPGEEAIGTLALSQPMREAIRQAFSNIEIYANVQFIEVPYELSAAGAQMTFGAFNFPGPLAAASAYAYLPDLVDTGLGNTLMDIWFDTKDFDPKSLTLDTSLGGAFYATALHEIGHALGFKHPFDIAPNSESVLSIFNNFEYNTLMAYEDDNVFNPLGRHPEGPSTLALYDVAQMQNVYGRNMTYNLDDTNYTYPVSHQQTLWDAGGIDTLDFSTHTVDESIDLRQGTFSTLYGIDLSLRIAYGTVIENVRSGSGNDRIQGNEEVNMIYGGLGDDTIIGSGNDDGLYGELGNDTYRWSLGDGNDMIVDSGGARDVIEIHDPSDTLNLLQQDLTFRRLGNDLQIDLTFDMGDSLGSIRIHDYGSFDGQIETLRMFGSTGIQIGSDIDLTSVFSAADNLATSFRVTLDSNANGLVAVPA